MTADKAEFQIFVIPPLEPILPKAGCLSCGKHDLTELQRYRMSVTKLPASSLHSPNILKSTDLPIRNPKHSRHLMTP
jgi:hypothetical protein